MRNPARAAYPPLEPALAPWLHPPRILRRSRRISALASRSCFNPSLPCGKAEGSSSDLRPSFPHPEPKAKGLAFMRAPPSAAPNALLPRPMRPFVLEFTKMSGAGNDFVVLDNRFFQFSEATLARLSLIHI